MAPPLRRVSIQGYRAARELELTPGSVCALVGEASSGKSTVLAAIWTLLEAAAPPPTIDDVARDGAGGRIRLEADVARGTIFLDARPPDKLEELALVRHTSTGGTSLFQPEPLAEAEGFRALSEFDSDRAELFLARCAVLVEGRTEKLTFPLVFDALGVDPDKEGILVLECGGKGNMPLFARVANACSIPYVVVHDRDAPRGIPPVESERVVNRQIREVAGSRRTVVLTPDFETVSGMKASNRGRKPQKAWLRYRGNGEVPEALRIVVQKVLKIAQTA